MSCLTIELHRASWRVEGMRWCELNYSKSNFPLIQRCPNPPNVFRAPPNSSGTQKLITSMSLRVPSVPSTHKNKISSEAIRVSLDRFGAKLNLE